MVREPAHLVATAQTGSIQPKPAEWRGHRERGSVRLLSWMVFLSLQLGRTASRSILYAIAMYFFLFAPAARRNSRRYLRLALGRDPGAAARFRQILYFATCIHDRVYLLNDQYERFSFTIEGEPLMRSLLDAGQGALLMGAHVGSFEAMRSIGRRQTGLRVAVVMYEQNARKINARLEAINPASKLDIIPLGQIDTMLSVADRLEHGAFVGMLGDRTLGDEPVQAVTLLGKRAYLPTGPMRLAAILRRPVIFMAGLYRGANRYHVVFAKIADFSNTPAGERDAAIKQAIESYAGLLDRYCRSDPYNWFNFFDFWRERTDKPVA